MNQLQERPFKDEVEGCRVSTRQWKTPRSLTPQSRAYITQMMVPELEFLVGFEEGMNNEQTLKATSAKAYTSGKVCAAIIPITAMGTEYFVSFLMSRPVPEVRVALNRTREEGQRHTAHTPVMAVLVDPHGEVGQTPKLVALCN